jgi:hypothetical protein
MARRARRDTFLLSAAPPHIGASFDFELESMMLSLKKKMLAHRRSIATVPPSVGTFGRLILAAVNGHGCFQLLSEIKT